MNLCFVQKSRRSATLAGSQNNGSNQSRGSSYEMDSTRSSKVNDTYVKYGIIPKGRQESVATPNGPNDHGVDEDRQEERVAQTRLHLASLGDSFRHNGSGSGSGSDSDSDSGSGGKGKLKEPSHDFTASSKIKNKKLAVPMNEVFPEELLS